MERRQRLGPVDRYGLVLLSIVVTYAISVSADPRSAGPLIVLVQLVTVWLVFSVSESPRALRTASLLIVSTAALAGIGVLLGPSISRDGAGLAVAYYVVSVVLYAVAPAVVLRHLARQRRVDGQTVLGAIAAYLLLGMMFGFCYYAVGQVQTDPPLFGAAGAGTMSDALFFSFVTLSTTGYGNLVPVANPGQSIAVLEAVVGQLFLVTAVAKVIADYRRAGP